MIQNNLQIRNLWSSKKIKFEPDINDDQISLCSIDLRLGHKFTYLIDNPGLTVSPSISNAKGLFETKTIVDGETIKIKENEFILGVTHEKITLPNNIAAMVEGRSTFARWGLSAHVTAPLINPGWIGHITLEMYNHGSHSIELTPGKDRVCQLILFKMSKPIPKKIIDNLSRYIGQTSPHPKPYEK